MLLTLSMSLDARSSILESLQNKGLIRLVLLFATLVVVESATGSSLAAERYISREEETSPISLNIGVITAESGSSAYFGNVIRNGIRLAFKEADVKGLTFQLIVLDDQSQESKAKWAVDNLDAAGVVAIIGPMESHTAAAAAAEASNRTIPLISPSATASSLTNPPSKWFFRANTSDKKRAEQLADWMSETAKHAAVGVIHECRTPAESGESELYGEAAGKDVISWCIGHSYPYVPIEYQRDTLPHEILKEIVERVQDSHCGAVAILGRSTDSRLIADALHRKSASLPIFLISPGKDMFGKPPLDNQLFAVTDTILESTADIPLLDFRTKYLAQFPNEPDPLDQYATFGFDTANIVIDALKRLSEQYAGHKTIGLETFRAELRLAIENTPAEREGIMSVAGFTTNHELNFLPHRLEMIAGQWREPGSAAGVGTKTSSGQTPSWVNIAILIGLSLLLVGLLVFFVRKLSRIAEYDDGIVGFVIILFAALVAAFALFGVLHSIGSVQGKSLGVAFEFGGPAALFVFVLTMGLRNQVVHRKRPFDMSVLIHKPGAPDSIMPVDGELIVYFGNGQIKYKIVNGQSIVKNIPGQFTGHSAKYLLDVHGFKAINLEPILLVPNGRHGVAIESSGK